MYDLTVVFMWPCRAGIEHTRLQAWDQEHAACVLRRGIRDRTGWLSSTTSKPEPMKTMLELPKHSLKQTEKLHHTLASLLTLHTRLTQAHHTFLTSHRRDPRLTGFPRRKFSYHVRQNYCHATVATLPKRSAGCFHSCQCGSSRAAAWISCLIIMSSGSMGPCRDDPRCLHRCHITEAKTARWLLPYHQRGPHSRAQPSATVKTKKKRQNETSARAQCP